MKLLSARSYFKAIRKPLSLTGSLSNSMVLKNSKWDKKAKYKYKKKHGLFNKNKELIEPRSKWSSKRAVEQAGPILQETDSEWDSEEEDEFLNHYYPQMGETSLTREQKKRLRQQLFQKLVDEQEEDVQESKLEGDDVEIDGIYLGDKSKEGQHTEPKVHLNDYLPLEPYTRTTKTRKMPKAKVSDNFLEEYGIENYSDTIKKDLEDYEKFHKTKQLNLPLNKISNEALEGFQVGKSSLAPESTLPKTNIKMLSDKEIKESLEMRAMNKRNTFLNQMKSKFSDRASAAKSGPVLEINNINDEDREHIDFLNSKITGRALSQDNGYDYQSDIDYLLGESKEHGHSEEDNKPPEVIDELLSQINISELQYTKEPETYSANDGNQTKFIAHDLNGQDYLDELLE